MNASRQRDQQCVVDVVEYIPADRDVEPALGGNKIFAKKALRIEPLTLFRCNSILRFGGGGDDVLGVDTVPEVGEVGDVAGRRRSEVQYAHVLVAGGQFVEFGKATGFALHTMCRRGAAPGTPQKVEYWHSTSLRHHLS